MKSVQTDSKKELIERINNWDYSHVKRYMLFRDGENEQTIDNLISEYKKYIYLVIRYKHLGIIFPISHPVDKVWHTHILDTRNYIAFSNAINGGYLHHNPAEDEDSRESLRFNYENYTLPYLVKEFGAIDSNIWALNSMECGCEG